MNRPLHLPKMIDKYMNYMTYIKSASPLTTKHYLIDLKQAFKHEPSLENNKLFYTEAELLLTARKAFNGWASLSLASRNRKASTLKSFFSWAFAEGLILQDLSNLIASPKVPKKIPHFISVDEAMAVLKAFEKTGDESRKQSHLQSKVLFLLIYGGGLRISEACNLKWRDIDPEQKILRVLGKGNKQRLIALPKLAFQNLVLWKQQQGPSEYVFGEKPINPRAAYELIRQSGIRAGLLKPLHPHALRHSFATHLLSSGANLRTLQELLGHESLQATEKYTHLGIDQLARTMEKIHPLGRGK